MSVPWVKRPVVDVDLALPVRERYARMPQEMVDAGKGLLGEVMAMVPRAAMPIADAVRLRTGGRFSDEISAIAERVGVSWRSVMLANVSYDLAIAFVYCSTVALATGEGPVLARNMDWSPEGPLARATYDFRCVERGAMRYRTAGWPGAIGVVTGMSGRGDRGFAVALNAVLCEEGHDKLGYPVLLHLRRVIEEAADFDEARSMLAEQRLAAPAMFTLVGVRNDQRVVIERTPRRHALRWAEGDAPLVTTNHYRAMNDRRALEEDAWQLETTSCARFDAASRFCAALDPAGRTHDDALLYMLSDPNVRQDITAQHIIMRPAVKEMSVYVPRRLVEPQA